MKRGLIFGIGAVILALVAGWFFFIRSDAPPPVSLEEAVAAATSTTSPGTPAPDDTTGATSTTVADTPPSVDGIDGSWTIDPANSFAGYRIGEELANIGTAEAVGRTSEVTGTLTASGTAITDVAIEVDMQTLRSDQSRRDNALRDRGLETGIFPTATFELTSPIDLGSVPAAGDTIETSATGNLTIHGVTQPVELALEGQVVDADTVIVVGSVDVTLTDHGIEAPTGFAVLSISEVGTLELQLQFART